MTRDRADHALDLPLAALARELAADAVSPVALAEAALGRAEGLGARLGAFVTVTRERALQDAHESARELRRGHHRGPLHGVPYGLKDNIDTRGIRTTWGSDLYAARVPAVDATVAARLAAAGGVLVGKLALTELAMGVSDPAASISGVCRNPWSLAHWAGASSAGPASAVAARLLPFALGTDTMGSVLGPAALCGVTALRPTYGVLSRAGVLPYAFSLDKVGILARSAEDCAVVLHVLAGHDAADPSTISAPAGLAPLEPHRARGLRAGVLALVPGGPDTPEIALQYEQALSALSRAGLRLERAALPDLPWGDVARVVVEAESEVALDDVIASGRASALRDPLHRGKPWVPLAGRPSDYVRAQIVRAGMQRAVAELQREFELVVSANSSVAPPVDGPAIPVGGDPMNVAGNLLGLPAVSVPMGLAGPAHLPVGLTLTGRPLHEAEVLAAAALYQERTSWHLERPPVLAG